MIRGGNSVSQLILHLNDQLRIGDNERDWRLLLEFLTLLMQL